MTYTSAIKDLKPFEEAVKEWLNGKKLFVDKEMEYKDISRDDFIIDDPQRRGTKRRKTTKTEGTSKVRTKSERAKAREIAIRHRQSYYKALDYESKGQ